MRGLYYSYTITSQSYSAAKSNSINAFNKLNTAAQPDTAAELINTAAESAAELADTIIVIEYYTGSTTNYHQQSFYNRSYTKYKIFFSAFLPKYFI